MTQRRRVMILFGGQSAEHDVSRVTAVAVAKALDPAKYDVVPVGITKAGEWLLAGDAQRMLASVERDALPAAFEVAGELVPMPTGTARNDLAVDVVIPLLHGPYGEDGTVQGLLDLAGLSYVGSGVLGSAVGMDKVAMKRMFVAAGLPIGRFLAVRDDQDLDAFATRVEEDLKYPAFIKPANMGSSVGVSKVRDRAQLLDALELALSYDEKAVAEEFVPGREIEVGVLGDRPPAASVPGEVIPAADFYSYADKYEDGKAELVIPAPLAPEQAEAVRALAIRAFDACSCEAMARVDFFLRGDGSFVVNELNTIPGFTPISMYPKLWEASGVPYAELLDRLINLAIDRAERRAARRGRQR